MKASRAAVRTAKAVKTVEERLAVIEERLAAIESILQQLVVAVSVDKPTTASKARTVRKRGGA